jgi:hypothetical protein
MMVLWRSRRVQVKSEMYGSWHLKHDGACTFICIAFLPKVQSAMGGFDWHMFELGDRAHIFYPCTRFGS